MPLVVTPRQLAHRAEFYYQLASLLGAGVPLLQALETVRRNPPDRSFLAATAFLTARLEEGSTFSEAACALGRARFPTFDVALLEASERSGRLESTLQFLAEYYRERAGLLRSVIADLGYPLFLLHAFVLIFPVSALTDMILRGDFSTFIAQKALILAPLYAVVALLIYAGQGRHGERWRALVERALGGAPVLGKARRNLALARLAAALEGLVSAGAMIIEAWPMAARASGSPALERTVARWKPSLNAGRTPGEMMRESPVFPDLFSSLYATAELSGSIDTTLRKLYQHYRDEGARQMRVVAEWAPRLVYLAIVLAVVHAVFSFWNGYFSTISEVID